MNGKDYTDTKETDVVDPLGHKYGEPTFKWSDDHKTYTQHLHVKMITHMLKL